MLTKSLTKNRNSKNHRGTHLHPRRNRSLSDLPKDAPTDGRPVLPTSKDTRSRPHIQVPVHVRGARAITPTGMQTCEETRARGTRTHTAPPNTRRHDHQQQQTQRSRLHDEGNGQQQGNAGDEQGHSRCGGQEGTGDGATGLPPAAAAAAAE